MEILKIRFKSDGEFRSNYRPEFPCGGVFCPTTTAYEPGQRIVVALIIPSLPNKILIRSTVRGWRPALPRLRVRAGATVEFDADEAEKRDFILETLDGGRRTLRRRHTRLPISVPVRFRVKDKADFKDGYLTEISVGGAMLHSTDLPLDLDVIVEITPPGAVRPIAISGKTAYHGNSGGTGLKFVHRDSGGSQRLKELVRRLKQA